MSLANYNSKPKYDLSGQTFGRLKVISYHSGYWKCLCSCKNITFVKTNSLISGRTTSCGCLGKERRIQAITKHGESKTRLYSIWRNMKCRCSCPTASKYEIYGGKGISVCAEWQNFEGFRNWAMSHGYSDNLSIDRINGKQGYCPENCRWVTYKVQANNTSQNHVISYNGEFHTLSEWAGILGFNYKVLSERIRRNWTIKRAFTMPTQYKGDSKI